MHVRLHYPLYFPVCFFVFFLVASVTTADNSVFLCVIPFYLIALACAVSCLTETWQKRQDAFKLLKYCMIIKIVDAIIYGILCYIMLFILMVKAAVNGESDLSWLGGMLIFLCEVSILLLSTGIVGLSAVILARKELQISRKAAIVNGIFQFIVGLDAASAIYLYYVVKGKTTYGSKTKIRRRNKKNEC